MKKPKVYSICGGGDPLDSDMHYIILPPTETLRSFLQKYRAWFKKINFYDLYEPGYKNAGQFAVDMLGGRYATDSEVESAKGNIRQVNLFTGSKKSS